MTVKLTIKDNGSILVDGNEGPFVVLDAGGQEYDLKGKKVVSLCRCGHSANKPFCDGAHKQAGFSATERAKPSGN